MFTLRLRCWAYPYIPLHTLTYPCIPLSWSSFVPVWLVIKKCSTQDCQRRIPMCKNKKVVPWSARSLLLQVGLLGWTAALGLSQVIQLQYLANCTTPQYMVVLQLPMCCTTTALSARFWRWKIRCTGVITGYLTSLQLSNSVGPSLPNSQIDS